MGLHFSHFVEAIFGRFSGPLPEPHYIHFGSILVGFGSVFGRDVGFVNRAQIEQNRFKIRLKKYAKKCVWEAPGEAQRASRPHLLKGPAECAGALAKANQLKSWGKAGRTSMI